LEGGNLPQGLRLSSSYGIIEGYPERTGTFTFTLKAINDKGSNTRQFTVVIESDQYTTPAIATASLPNGNVGVNYSRSLSATGGGITWSLESGTLPAGLTLSASGVISGAPTTIGTSTFTVKATNAAGSDTKEFSIAIEAASPIISATLQTNPLKAWMQSGTLHLSGLTAGKTWSIYNAKGTLVQQGVANGAEASIRLNVVSGVYFVKSNGQTLRIVNK
jgi:hypothetical protein